MIKPNEPRIIAFRRWRLAVFGIISLLFASMAWLVLWIQPADLSGLKLFAFVVFALLLMWFASYNCRLLWLSFQQNIGLEMDDEGFRSHTVFPAIPVKIRWDDIMRITIIQQQIGISSIEQLHIIVPHKAPYLDAQSWLGKYIAKQRNTQNPITFIINVQQLDTTPKKLAQYMSDYAQRNLF